jgi:hypothetical protein
MVRSVGCFVRSSEEIQGLAVAQLTSLSHQIQVSRCLQNLVSTFVLLLAPRHTLRHGDSVGQTTTCNSIIYTVEHKSI